jgi:streptogrisin C
VSGAAATSIVAALLTGVPATAVSLSSGSQQATADDPNAEAEAMAANLGITQAQAAQRIKKQDTNSDKGTALEARLGSAKSAGSYLDPTTGDLKVNVTDAQAAAQVRAAGATPRLVKNSEAALETAKTKLDATSASTLGTASWSIDPATDAVRLTTMPGTPDKAISGFLKKAGVSASQVSVSKTGRKLTTYGLIGGDDTEIFKNGVEQAICSIGFIAKRTNGKKVAITAGHCSLVGTDYRRIPDKRKIGTVAAKEHTFGTAGDYSLISIAHPTLWHPFGPYVNMHAKKFKMTPVKGSTAKAIGAYVCKSGRTTGWTCGHITAKNVTVWVGAEGKYYQVKGLTDSTICSLPGDSGGSVIASGQAQGLVSAGPATTAKTCKAVSDPETLFQPINPVLKKFKLKLLTK